MDAEICRACLGTSEGMVNIFDSMTEGSISIAAMISKCKGIRVSKEDSLPNTICPHCLLDVQHVFQTKQLYERSKLLFCQTGEEEISAYESDNSKKYDRSTQTEKVHCEVKTELEKGKPRNDELDAQVKNEPIEEDIFENDQVQTSDCEVDQVNFQIKSEECDDLFKKDIVGNEHTSEDEPFDKSPYKCSHCQKSYLQHGSLQRHIRTHTRNPSYKCSYCQKSFSRNEFLQRHIRTHTGERPFQCSICPKAYSVKHHLKDHMVTHTGNGVFKCPHCQKSFSNNRTFQEHKRTHTGERPYKCSHCQKTFTHQQNFKTHLVTHTGERPYKCTHCHESFSRNGTLQQHIRGHTGDRPYTCGHCQKPFLRKGTLQRHIRIHTGEEPYKCRNCQRSFSRNEYLQRHIQTHTENQSSKNVAKNSF